MALDKRELEHLSGDASNGQPYMDKAEEYLVAARVVRDTSLDAAFDLAYDAGRFIAFALLAQQGLRATIGGGHVAATALMRVQFGERFDFLDEMRRARNTIDYTGRGSVQAGLVEDAITWVAETLEASEKLLPALTIWRR